MKSLSLTEGSQAWGIYYACISYVSSQSSLNVSYERFNIFCYKNQTPYRGAVNFVRLKLDIGR